MNLFKTRTLKQTKRTQKKYGFGKYRTKYQSASKPKKLVTDEHYYKPAAPVPALFELWLPKPRRTKISRVGTVRPVENPVKKQIRSRHYALPQLRDTYIASRSNQNVRLYEQGLICTRRREREEILHALKKTGKLGQKPKQLTAESKLICERIY